MNPNMDLFDLHTAAAQGDFLRVFRGLTQMSSGEELREFIKNCKTIIELTEKLYIVLYPDLAYMLNNEAVQNYNLRGEVLKD